MGEATDWRNAETTAASELFGRSPSSQLGAIPAWTILCHPDPLRVGEQAPLLDLERDGTSELSRLSPVFHDVERRERRPLADSCLSRQPIILRRLPDGRHQLDTEGSSMRVAVGGVPLEGCRTLDVGALERGVVVLVASRVALLLHWLQPFAQRPPSFGLVGESHGVVRLRREIERIADLDYPVLLRGESGTGKELVAQAIQQASPRREGPYVAVNMAAIPATLAAAELFGAAKGAFSGATRRRSGYFQKAHGGTLFLDEVGDMPLEVQALLLRVLESHEIQPVGGEVPQPVDVRVIAATDADLEQAMEEGRFRGPLLHRLASFEIELPPLRQRRSDIGRLFFHFLAQELDALGEGERLASSTRRHPWVDAGLVARLATLDWPGNVRQLRNVVRQLAVASRGAEGLIVGSRVERLLERAGESSDASQAAEPHTAESQTPSPKPARRYRDPQDVGEDELIETLKDHQYRLQPTATALGVSRASLYALIDACPKVRKASDLSPEEIAEASRDCDGRPAVMAEQLEVSAQGLKMRLKELGPT